MRYYIGIIHKDEDSDFGISFPDFPGCISAGSDLAELSEMGKDALYMHISLLEEDGLPIPEPTSIDVIMEDSDNRTGIPVLVPAAEVTA
jgi:predicted RNase H-like HicB family nuclease